MIKAVLFDMDGTIVNSEKYYADETYEFFKSKGVIVEPEVCFGLVGLSMEECYLFLQKFLHDDVETIEKDYLGYFEEHPIDYLKYRFKDTYDTFKRLKEEGYLVAICSGSPLYMVNKAIKQMKLDDLVDFYIAGDQVKNGKPNPEAYLTALNHFGLKKEEAIIIEDSPVGIQAGKNSGIYTCARRDVQFGLDQSAADIIIESLGDVFDVIRSRNV